MPNTFPKKLGSRKLFLPLICLPKWIQVENEVDRKSEVAKLKGCSRYFRKNKTQNKRRAASFILLQ